MAFFQFHRGVRVKDLGEGVHGSGALVSSGLLALAAWVLIPVPGCGDTPATGKNEAEVLDAVEVDAGLPCDDNNPCTEDFLKADGTCANTPFVDASCDDGNKCTTGDSCSKDGLCVGAGATSCDDGNGCTQDSCDPASGCRHEPVADGEPCQDGDSCSVDDKCGGGVCVPGTMVVCDDPDPTDCTYRVCDKLTGDCNKSLVHPDGHPCSEGNPCTDNDECDENGKCAPGTAHKCEAQNPCKTSWCNETAKEGENPCQWDWKKEGVGCDDGDACSEDDQCEQKDGGTMKCSGTPIECGDGNPCTADSCKEESGCSYTTLSDGSPCALAQGLCGEKGTCKEGVCVGNGGMDCNDNDPCTVDTCSAEDGKCVHEASSGAACDDLDPCTDVDVCSVDGKCAGTVKDCSVVSDDCLLPVCDPTTGKCGVPAQDGTSCSDGDACNGAETCLVGICQNGVPPECSDDGNLCTADGCDKELGCVHPPVDEGTPCDDGDPCNGLEACQLGQCLTFIPATPCVPIDACHEAGVCDPATGKCLDPPKKDGADCDDGDLCNGVWECQSGVCTETELAVECPVPDQCHDAAICDSETGQCSGQPKKDGTDCDDGDECTLSDECSAGICKPGGEELCDDGNACTTDSCDPVAGCGHVPNSLPCEDGSKCTDGDVCSEGICKPGTPKVCDDGNECTEDTCDPAAGCAFPVVVDGQPCGQGMSGKCVGGQCQSGACSSIGFDGKDDCIALPSFPYSFPLSAEGWFRVGLKAIETQTLFQTQCAVAWVARHVDGSARITVAQYLGCSGTSSRWWSESDPLPLSLGWHHVALASASASEAALFLDGKPLALSAMKLDSGVVGKEGFSVGCNHDLNAATHHHFLEGGAASVRFSSSVRYAGAFQPAYPLTSDQSTVALYALNEGSGQVVVDSSGHGYAGTAIGGTWLGDAPECGHCGGVKCPALDGYEVYCNPQDHCEYTNKNPSGWKKWDVWIYVPPGQYSVGSPKAELGHMPNEEPEHPVTLDYGYFVGKYEVTVDQYEACIGSGDCSEVGTASWDCYGWGTNHASDRATHPQNSLLHTQAVDFCRWTAPGGRLPTEAEWEAAASGPTHRKYPWGDSPEPTCENGTAVFDGDASESPPWGCQECDKGECGGTLPVGTRPAGASWCGALDMAGNVWEWVEDYPQGNYEGAPEDGSAVLSPVAEARDVRGGSFTERADRIRTSIRDVCTDSSADLGVRCVRPAPAVSCGGTQCPPLAGYFVTCNRQDHCEYYKKDTTGWRRWDVWIYVPPGTTKLGSPVNEAGHAANEEDPSQPDKMHPVTFAEGYFIGKYEVVVEQYEACQKAGKCSAAGTTDWPGKQGTNTSTNGRASHPQNGLTWAQSSNFCNWVVPGGRLPSEAEWEYAAKGPAHRKYPWGDSPEPTCSNGTAVMNETGGEAGYGCGSGGTGVEGLRSAGASWSGALDMSGNLWEWVEDWYHPSFQDAPVDGAAWLSPTSQFKVGRGGAFFSTAPNLRTAVRGDSTPPTYRSGYFGARCVRPLPGDCVPSCAGKQCGGDGCGGSCGECGEGGVCWVDSKCHTYCEVWGPEEEVCDGLDNDCDGLVDENLDVQGHWARHCGGIVTDLTKVRLWAINPFGPSNHAAGQAYCQALVLSGQSDWRLPNINELRSLVEGCPSMEEGGACSIIDPTCLNPAAAPVGCWNSACSGGCPPLSGPGEGGCYWQAGIWNPGDCSPVPFWSSSSQPNDAFNHKWLIRYNEAGIGTDGPEVTHPRTRCVASSPCPIGEAMVGQGGGCQIPSGACSGHADGTVCDDGNALTVGDVCTGGKCGGKWL